MDPLPSSPDPAELDLSPGPRLALDSQKPGGRDTARVAFEWVGLVVLALIIALLIKAFLFQAFYIPSESMVPTLQVHDRVLVNKLSYKLHPVHRGDIVVFKAPPDSDPGIDDLVKRVVGLPGDSVSAKGGHVFINGAQLKEPYLPAGTSTSGFDPVKVPDNSYWVMGDNRDNSKDSRVFGVIAKDKIVGRVFVRIWPFSRFGRM